MNDATMAAEIKRLDALAIVEGNRAIDAIFKFGHALECLIAAHPTDWKSRLPPELGPSVAQQYVRLYVQLRKYKTRRPYDTEGLRLLLLRLARGMVKL